MFQSALHRENGVYCKMSFKDWKYQIQFISIDWGRFTTENEMARMRLWASPITLENMDNMGSKSTWSEIMRDGRNFQVSDSVSVSSFKSEEKCLCRFWLKLEV